jgi:hypothetical protein
VLRRLIDLVITSARQAVPVGGIFAFGWQPPVALAVYWLESALLVAIAVWLCFRLRAETSPMSIAEARADGDAAFADALQGEAKAIAAAGVNPRDVLLFHGGSMAIMGAMFAGILLILTLNGRIDPIDWVEMRQAAGAMAIVLGVGFVIDRLMMPIPSVTVVQARVNACNGRWALMWLLGFGGTAAVVFTGRPHTFFQVFAVLKLTWEMWGLLARTFGWKSLQDRSQAPLARQE